MPYKSVKQQKFFHSAGAKKAGISPATVKEFDQATKAENGFKKLPERAKEKQTKAKNRKR